MRFTLTFTMDNAAFTDGINGTEASRTLHNLAHKLHSADLKIGDGGDVLDSNGNRVGAWAVEK